MYVATVTAYRNCKINFDENISTKSQIALLAFTTLDLQKW